MTIAMSESLERVLVKLNMLTPSRDFNPAELGRMTEANLLRAGMTRGSLNELKDILRAKNLLLKNELPRRAYIPSERNVSIYRMRKSGATFREMGESHGISTTRARQIFFKMVRMKANRPLLSELLDRECCE